LYLEDCWVKCSRSCIALPCLALLGGQDDPKWWVMGMMIADDA